MSEEVLKLVNVTVGYAQQKVVKQINATVGESELITVLGKNGVGKSTILNSIMGFQPFLEGDVFLNKQPMSIFSAQELAQKIAIVLPRLNYIPMIKIKELVAMGRLPYGKSWQKYTKEDESKIEEALDLVGMGRFTNEYATQISEGQLQLVMIARALCQDTSLIILDEPTSNLDLENQYMIFNLLADLSKKTKKSLIVATHELNLALEKSDKVWWVEQGILQEDIPEQLAYDEQIYSKLAGDYVYFDNDVQRFVVRYTNQKPIQVVGSSELSYWVRNAVIRKGYYLSSNEGELIKVNENIIMIKNHQLTSICELVNYIDKIK